MSAWRNCSEVMPEENVEVLILRRNLRMQIAVFKEPHGWLRIDGTGRYMGVTHWQPLPEPPEEETK